MSATPLLPDLPPEVCSYGALRLLHEAKHSFILPIWHNLSGYYVQ